MARPDGPVDATPGPPADLTSRGHEVVEPPTHGHSDGHSDAGIAARSGSSHARR